MTPAERTPSEGKAGAAQELPRAPHLARSGSSTRAAVRWGFPL
jgi:hypothetical protein